MEEEIIKSLEVLKSGGTLLYPTDTIWGIGCDATNAEAVDKIYHIKKRMGSKSLIILLDDSEKILDYVEDVPDIAWDLMESPGPLTIVYPNAKNLPDNVIASDNSIAIRIVRNEFCKRLITRFGKPIVSSSANRSGDAAPVVYKNIRPEIIQSVDYAVNYQRDTISQMKASRIIRLFESGEFQLIRD